MSDRYEVGITAYTHVAVEADNEEEAREAALDRVHVGECDIDEVRPNRLETDGGVDTAVWYDLTGFQRDTLRAIRAVEQSSRDPYGLAIKGELSARYGEEINHGRLYPNLDSLADQDLVAKSKLDDRTNRYDLTERGRSLLEATVALDTQLVTETDLRARTDGGEQ